MSEKLTGTTDDLQVAGMTQEKTQWKQLLETLSFLQWELCFLFLGPACVLLLVYLMFTSLWPLSTLYFVWLVTDWQTPERGKVSARVRWQGQKQSAFVKFVLSPSGGRRTTSMRKWRVWEHLRDYFPVKLVKTAELNPNKNYIFGCHPHGIMSVGSCTCFATDSCNFSQTFPGVRPSLATLSGLFRIPLYRDYMMSAGLVPVSKSSLAYMLSQNGKGNAVVIVIGGAAESLASSPGVNTVVVKQRKGFVRIALEFGADLVPVYSFGENELFQQVIFSVGSVGQKLQGLFKKIMGFAPCLFVGERLALLPYRIPVTVVVGPPISVPKCTTPTEEEVDHYHKLYMEALSELFHQHKVSCGLSESHELQII